MAKEMKRWFFVPKEHTIEKETDKRSKQTNSHWTGHSTGIKSGRCSLHAKLRNPQEEFLIEIN